MPAFIQGGGYDETISQLIAAKALEVWGIKQGFAVNDKLVDGEIASVQAFNGPTGQFDRKVFESVLAQRKMTEDQLRREIAGDIIRRQMLVPIAGAAAVPADLVKPYAELLIEQRSGSVGIVPIEALPPSSPPSEAELLAYYNGNVGRYSLPERRVLRYALFGKEQLKSVPQPSEAEIEAFYKANAATYGATQTRILSQVVLPDQKAAEALAAKVKGGTSFAAAAQTAGFSATDIALGEKTQAQLAELASPTVAAAAFSAPEGATIAPTKSELGWHVIHVDSIKATAGKTLAQVHDTIAKSLADQKIDEALANMASAVEDQVTGGATFDDVVKSEKLTVINTPPLTNAAAAPDQPGYQPPPEVQLLIKPAFQAESGDEPTVENIGKGELHALLSVAQVVPAAPIPFAQAKQRVASDLLAYRAGQRAKAIADAIVAKANAGTPFAQAIAEAAVKLPPPQKIQARQVDFARNNQQMPPPIAVLFNLSTGKTQALAAPNGKGWFIVHLDSTQKGDLSQAPGLLDATRGQFSRVTGQEYIEQFANAAERDIGVKRNESAIAALRAQLAGNAPSPDK
jgi:peptidyl-prolyl cis-trans isomerase D